VEVAGLNAASATMAEQFGTYDMEGAVASVH